MAEVRARLIPDSQPSISGFAAAKSPTNTAVKPSGTSQAPRPLTAKGGAPRRSAALRAWTRSPGRRNGPARRRRQASASFSCQGPEGRAATIKPNKAMLLAAKRSERGPASSTSGRRAASRSLAPAMSSRRVARAGFAASTPTATKTRKTAAEMPTGCLKKSQSASPTRAAARTSLPDTAVLTAGSGNRAAMALPLALALALIMWLSPCCAARLSVSRPQRPVCRFACRRGRPRRNARADPRQATSHP
jgi:hypothetical protein